MPFSLNRRELVGKIADGSWLIAHRRGAEDAEVGIFFFLSVEKDRKEKTTSFGGSQ